MTELISTEELISSEWRTGIAEREKLNELDWDELMLAIDVELNDNVPVKCTDTYYDSMHKEYVVSFSLD